MSLSIERSIVHMDLDTFFVSCERLIDSRLNNRPVLIGGTSDRGVVASCSYEARKFGIHSAMPMRMAKQLCPEAIVLRGNSGIYTKYSKLVTDVVADAVPLYEKSSIDEFYIDLTGMDKFFGCHQLASELRQRIMRETGLPISFGLSINKTVSKIATGEAKPNNEIKINSGTEKYFL
ncbi:MAG: DNA polymerase IV, partial [Flavobacteriaceae bacterium]|nr:DNA polymerase IV [Flavobacteriaceae bacterium]